MLGIYGMYDGMDIYILGIRLALSQKRWADFFLALGGRSCVLSLFRFLLSAKNNSSGRMYSMID